MLQLYHILVQLHLWGGFGGGGQRWRSEVGGGGQWRRSVAEVGGGSRWRSVAEVGGGWWRRLVKVGSGARSRRSEVGGGGRRTVEVDVRVRIICGVVVEGVLVVVVIQASGFARGVSIPGFISLFQFIFFQCLNQCRLNGLLPDFLQP